MSSAGPGETGKSVRAQGAEELPSTQEMQHFRTGAQASATPETSATDAARFEQERGAATAGREIRGFHRLSALDSLFLAVENERDLMHIGITGIFEKGPLRTPDGGLDRDRIRSHSRSVLCSLPKFRKKIAWVPLLRRPVLVDDDHFDPDFHLRFLTLEHESIDELQSLIGRIYSDPLDRARPLWEVWVIDGLPDDTFAVVTKTHHCLVDGVAGVSAFAAMLSASPDASLKPEPRWNVEPSPTPLDLLKSELQRVVQLASTMLRLPRPDLRNRYRTLTTGMSYALKAMLPRVSRTSLNPPRVGMTRSFAWEAFDLSAVKAVKNATSTKVNDVVLATVAGAMRRVLERRGEDIEHVWFRAMVPVSTHELGSDSLANDVAYLLVPLPLREPDPKQRLARVSSSMNAAKSSGAVQAVNIIEKMADVASFGAVTAFARAAVHLHAYNVIVTNIRGPDIPLYFQGAKLVGAYPLVPLYGDNALGIAILSCGGKLYWGFNADSDRVPDLPQVVEDVKEAFHELERAVGA